MGDNFNQEILAQQFESLELLQKKYKNRLDEILYRQLTVENISTFASDALDGVVILTNEILEQYNNNSNFSPIANLDDRAKEDDAFKKLNLPNLQDVLQSIIEVKSKIDDIKKYIDESKVIVGDAMIPPQDNTKKIESGSGNGIIEKKFVPRLLTLIYLLEQDFAISKDEILVTEGSVESSMMRKTPYVRVLIEQLNRVAYICDEEGNASYIFDTKKLDANSISFKQIDLGDKGDLNKLINEYGGIGKRIIQTSQWRWDVGEVLGQEIQVEVDGSATLYGQESVRESEFKKERKKEFLTYEDFQKEVRENYSGESSIYGWYKSVRKLHKDWPSLPDIKYRNNGWKSWPELVGHEKKEMSEFAQFKKQVKDKYGGQSNIDEWYSEEYVKHDNWPSAPSVTYKNDGWISWANLLDLEEINYLTFDEFKNEVCKLYVEGTSVTRWYQKEKKKHSNWPSSPQQTYMNKGWKSWLELIGKEKIKFLDFQEFKVQVSALYPGSVAIIDWYNSEKYNHKDWPQKPGDTYEKKGWTNWFELVGQERTQFLFFDEFKKEIILAYKGEPNIREWYDLERKKHNNWPSRPAEKYENEWKGWPELINKEKVEIVSFEDFKQQIKKGYPGSGSFEKWYKTERQFHADWPGAPSGYYKDMGWSGWLDLIDKSFAVFSVFKREVMESFSSYQGDLNIQKWYQKEKNNHKDWPSNPDQVYKDNGWKNWTELTGVEKINLLSLQELKKEVIALYPKIGSIKDWYDKERRNHKKWPSTPATKYKNDNWVNWQDLVSEK